MKLRAYLKVEEISIAAFARRCGVSRMTMRKIVIGKCVPRPVLMLRICAATFWQVLPNDFYDLPELRAAA